MSDRVDENTDEAIYESGRELLREGRVDEGVQRLLEVASRMPRALGDIAWARWMRGENESALESLKEYRAHFPQDPGAPALMARISRELNRRTDARTYARKAAAARPPKAETWYELGEILVYARDWTAAADAFGRCLELDPEMTRAAVRREFALRCGGSAPLRFLRKWFPRRLGRWVLPSNLIGSLIEQDTGIVLNERRWDVALVWGTAAEIDPPAADEAFRRWFESLELAGPVRRVLELGFGSGEVAAFLAGQGYDVLAATRSEFVRRERERRGLAAVRTDIHQIDRPGESFDLIVDNFALHHSRAAIFALWEWKRLLRPDGYLVVAARLAVDGADPRYAASAGPTGNRLPRMHWTFGTPGQVMVLTYWQLRWLFKQTEMSLIAESLADPVNGVLESVEYVDGRREADPTRPWIAFFLLRKPGRLPYDDSLERPREIRL